MGEKKFANIQREEARTQKSGKAEAEQSPEKSRRKGVKKEKRLAEEIVGIQTREGILEYLGNSKAKMIMTEKGVKYKTDRYLKRIKAVFDGKLRPDAIGLKALADKAKVILELEEADARSKKDNSIQPEQLPDAMGISDKSFPDEVVAEPVTAPTNELNVPSPGAEVKPSVEAEVDPLEPGEMEGGSLGVEVIPSEEDEEIGPKAIEPEKEPEPKKPEEGPEEKESKAKERQEKLAQLKAEVEQTRKEYVEMDYKKNKAYKRLGKFFGTLFKEKHESTRETDSDVAWCRAHYDAKILEYQELLLEDAIERKVSNRELGLVLKEFLVEKNISTAKTHTEVKIENQEGAILSIFKENSKKITEWYYNGLSKKERLAYGAAFGITLASVAWALPAAAGVAASAATMRRVFSSIVVGTSTALGAEARGITKDKEKVEQETEALTKSLEGLSEEEKVRIISEMVNRDIKYANDNVVAKLKNRNLRHLAYGMGAGFVTAVVAPRIGKMVGGLIGEGWHKIAEFWQNHPGGIIEGTGAADITGTETPISAPAEADALRPAGVPGANYAEAPSGSGAAVPESGTSNEAFHKTFAEGDSVEKPIIGYLDKHPEVVERYNELNGDRGFDSGQVAHRMALEYANEKGIPFEKLNDVLPGQELELSPDGTKIMEISGDDHMGYQPENEAAGENIPEMPEGGSDSFTIDKRTLAEINGFEGQAHEISDHLNQMQGDLGELDDSIAKLEAGDYEVPKGLSERRDSLLKEIFDEKEKLKNTMYETIHRYYRSLSADICGSRENFEKISNIRAGAVIKEKINISRFVQKILDSSDKKMISLKEFIENPKNSNLEFKSWAMRLAEIMSRSGIKKI